MKINSLKCIFLIFIILLCNSVFCQDADTDKSDEHSVKSKTEKSTDVSQHTVTTTARDDNIEPTIIQDSKTTTTTIRITRTTEVTTTRTTTRTTTTTRSSTTTTSSSSSSDNVPTTTENQVSQVQTQVQTTQPTVDPTAVLGSNVSTNIPSVTNNSIGTINTNKVDDNNKKEEGVSTWYMIVGLGLIAVIVIAAIGFTIAVQKKKKNNSQNQWSGQDDFDSRVVPIAPPANTYNLNNTPITQPPITQPIYQTNYGQAPVMTEAYNQGQAAYAEPTDMQMPPTSGVSVPIDNSYSDYGNTQSNSEYLPTSIDELKINNVYVSQFTFQPELDDEIEINIDDQIYIEEIFADNWALGVNTTNNARGCFPLNIFLNPKSTLDNSRSQRTLSYCSTGNGPSY